MKLICYVLIVCLLGLPLAQSSSARIESWQEKVQIDRSTIVEHDSLIRLMPGTKITLSGCSNLAIKGQVVASGTDAKPVIIAIPNIIGQTDIKTIKGPITIQTNQELKELQIEPYSIETDEIVSELEAFRNQYAFVWVVLMGVQIYLVMNRTTYW